MKPAMLILSKGEGNVRRWRWRGRNGVNVCVCGGGGVEVWRRRGVRRWKGEDAKGGEEKDGMGWVHCKVRM